MSDQPIFPPNCPVQCLGIISLDFTLIFQRPTLGIIHISANNLGRNALIALMGGTTWLEENFPRWGGVPYKPGEYQNISLVVTGFDQPAAASALIIECCRVEAENKGVRQ